ncbi:YihY/virulence factor BrkB family protein [Sphingomonas sp.]|uniref:YihY/virulence factor BrkB family protein n=1 Tax=Sphingomonas sp. TaxID=28214 RepID=UPI002B866D5A|nr:YihY/virulence factor BrkB family protein [Sphingomonas sp.]HWK36990.1 YihY/virulence factor BrkB family protein [Sphingomonas sp.]
MAEVSPLSPEGRAEHPKNERRLDRHRPFVSTWEIVKRAAIGVYNDGFIHAGNLAYLALLTVFPFFIVAAAIASLLGQGPETQHAVASFLHVLPPSVGDILRKPIADVLAARQGTLLWLGALVGLWTVGSFIETIRDIFRRAYGVKATRSFWRYRIGSALVTIGSVILALVAFLVQGVMLAAEQFVYRLVPLAQDLAGWIGVSRVIPGLVMFGALYMLFLSVTPGKYRVGGCRKWPGALFTALWWIGITALLPVALANFASYDLTYGSLAGVIVALLFFYLVGLGLVFGAHLNAALAEPDLNGLKATATNQEKAVAA